MLGGIELNEFKGAVSLPQDLASAYVECVESLVGCSYKPVLFVGTQLVNGTNYFLLCEQTMVTNPPVRNLVEVVINVPAGSIGGKGASLVRITPIEL